MKADFSSMYDQVSKEWALGPVGDYDEKCIQEDSRRQQAEKEALEALETELEKAGKAKEKKAKKE